ncbi:hypothetical protein LOAG_09638 [Loa loa]|uniref:Uncharacterized protein n=1 Tax=Loa loa TaxID=7209 RepID=A0A1S0TS26_LOALO|nr:hypothetical protein LOAG_09638 [Loa loa]EFO18857.1 hypothetical protein LOAG_09638 [Loa loa]
MVRVRNMKCRAQLSPKLLVRQCSQNDNGSSNLVSRDQDIDNPYYQPANIKSDFKNQTNKQKGKDKKCVNDLRIRNDQSLGHNSQSQFSALSVNLLILSTLTSADVKLPIALWVCDQFASVTGGPFCYNEFM